MSHGYVPVNWNRRKKIYDGALWLGILLYLAAFIGLSKTLYTGADAISGEIVIMRALSTCAFLMLTIILCIGPLARLDRRFLPLLYNRRHFGVSMFIIAAQHAAVAVYWYHAFGVVNPIISIFTSGGGVDVAVAVAYPTATAATAASALFFADVPFQAFGAVALLLLCVMAATSHDYWNANLGGPLWKALHMGVYLAYGLLIAHLVFGALQQDNTGLAAWMAAASVVLVGGLHLFAGFARSGADADLTYGAPTAHAASLEWVAVGDWRDIPNNRAIVVSLNAAERIAVFRYDGNQLAAVSNVCQHQNGPLGEGRVLDGLITCPWHGYQYRPQDGCSPPPFTEKIQTYRLRVTAGQVFVAPTPEARGTPRAVITVDEAEHVE